MDSVQFTTLVGSVGRERILLSVVIPVFNESEVIETCYNRTTIALGAIGECEYELLFVDDGSQDESWQKLWAIVQRDAHVRVIKLSRNFGHQIAITAGIDHARGECVVVMDADLQDPPEVISAMVEKWRQGYDVVYGERAVRAGESRMKLATAALFYRVLKRVAGINVPVDVGDFRLMSRRATEQLKQLREKDRYIRGLVAWIGFRQTGVPYHRDKRYAGKTKFTYSKMIKFAIDGIASFSTIPLKLATWLGYISAGFAFAYLLSVFVQKAMGITVEGWATVMVSMLFLGGVQLICLGIIGEYLGRVFNEIKPRPIYVIDEILGMQDSLYPEISESKGLGAVQAIGNASEA
jgi:polyisoprenyl-phosphate glycosyltransferase